MKFTDTSTKIINSYNHFTREGTEPYPYRTGNAYARCGMVNCFSQRGHTSLLFMVSNRLYQRTFDREYSPRGLSKVANDFAREISERETKNHD